MRVFTSSTHSLTQELSVSGGQRELFMYRSRCVSLYLLSVVKLAVEAVTYRAAYSLTCYTLWRTSIHQQCGSGLQYLFV